MEKFFNLNSTDLFLLSTGLGLAVLLCVIVHCTRKYLNQPKMDKLNQPQKGETTTMITLTRAYKVKSTGAIKTQQYALNPTAVASVRPSNVLGKALHRSTITLLDGTEVNVSERFSDVQNKLGVRVA